MITTVEELVDSAIRDHQALQKHQELIRFINFLSKKDVKTVLEIGSDAGGTLFVWNRLGYDVFSIDLPYAGFSGSKKDHFSHGATVLPMNSHNPHTPLVLKGILDGKKLDLLFLDGDHSYEGVIQDFDMYSDLVRFGGLIAFHDILENRTGETYFDGQVERGVEVHRAWKELLDCYSPCLSYEFCNEPLSWGGIGVMQKDWE